MPSDHLACNKTVWDNMPEHHRRIMEVAMEKLALRQAMSGDVANAQAANELRAAGVSIYDWSPEDRAKFKAAAQASWPEFATTPEAEALVASHLEFLKDIGVITE
jgi:TRAP-type C4-dicarboxylate transport system substrate-binding protein